MMTQYRKKPVVIDAFQWNPKMVSKSPDWFLNELGSSGSVFLDIDGSVIIYTLEGDMTASLGDYIIKGVKGEMYPCKPDIFELTYDPVGDLES